MDSSLAIMLRQLCYGKISFIVLVPDWPTTLPLCLPSSRRRWWGWWYRRQGRATPWTDPWRPPGSRPSSSPSSSWGRACRRCQSRRLGSTSCASPPSARNKTFNPLFAAKILNSLISSTREHSPVRLTTCLTGFDWPSKQVKLMFFIQQKQNSWI